MNLGKIQGHFIYYLSNPPDFNYRVQEKKMIFTAI